MYGFVRGYLNCIIAVAAYDCHVASCRLGYKIVIGARVNPNAAPRIDYGVVAAVGRNKRDVVAAIKQIRTFRAKKLSDRCHFKYLLKAKGDNHIF